MQATKIGLRQVLAAFEQSVQDGQVKPFTLSFFTKSGKYRTLTCHKALKEIDLEKNPSPKGEGRGEVKKKFSPFNFKVLLIQKVNPIDDRDKIKTVKICLLVRFNHYIIDHRR